MACSAEIPLVVLSDCAAGVAELMWFLTDTIGVVEIAFVANQISDCGGGYFRH